MLLSSQRDNKSFYKKIVRPLETQRFQGFFISVGNLVCENEGKEYLGVDYETLNPTALRFWDKYFQNYTYSYVRRIDERLADYKNA